jgi:hypothetical protein
MHLRPRAATRATECLLLSLYGRSPKSKSKATSATRSGFGNGRPGGKRRLSSPEAPLDMSFRTIARRASEIVLIGQSSEWLNASALAYAPRLLREPGSGTRATTEEFKHR